jgi:site-specific DNA recombinase
MLSIVYVRVSTETQEKRGYSIPEQIEAGKNKAISLGAKENEILVFVDSESGEFLNRTEFQKAIDTVENSNVDYFICLDPDRFSRKTVNALIAHEKIEKQGTEIVYCNNEYDKSPEGRLFLQMKMIIAEYEKEKIKVRTMMGKLGKAKRKLLTHNPNLYGYDYDPINDLLIINEEEAKIIIMIIRWVLDEKTTGMNKIANRLNSMGVLPP